MARVVLGWTGKAWSKTLGRLNEDREEYGKVVWLFLYLFFVVSASTVGRTAADALFLSRFDASHLSRMYLPQAAALIGAGFLFQRYGSRIRLDRLLGGLIPAAALLVLLSRIGVGAGLVWVFPVIYVGYDVLNSLMIVCFWQFATSLLDQRKAKRMLPLVGSGGIVGGIISGFGLQVVVPLIGTPNLIVVYAGLQLLALSAVVALVRRSGNPAELFRTGGRSAGKAAGKGAGKPGQRTVATEGGLFRNVPHLRNVAVMSAAIILTLTLVDYQFKVILGRTLQNDALAGFMGSFYGFSGLLALGVQLFVASRVVSRFGVMTALLVFPLALLAGSVGVLALPVLAAAVIAKGSDRVLGDTIHSSATQLILFPIPPEWRNRAKSFMDGIVRNGAKGLAAVILMGLSPLLDIRSFGWLIAGLLGITLFAIFRIKGPYLKLLLSTLEKRDLALGDEELDLVDPASRNVLVTALGSPDKEQARYALRVLSGLDGFDPAPHLPRLLAHSSPEVRTDALAVMERTAPPGQAALLAQLLPAERDGRVKAQLLLALSAYGDDSCLELVSEALDDPDVEVRAGAIGGLIKYYGIEGMFRSVGTLKALIASTAEEERRAMASLFGRIGIRTFYKPLISLLNDPSAAVRRGALQSAAELQVPELVPHLVPLLRQSGTRRYAVDALSAYDGAVVFPLLEPYFDEDEPPLHLPKVYERIATREAFERLLSRYEAAGLELRDKLLEALVRLSAHADSAHAKRIETLTLQEIAAYDEFGEGAAALNGEDANDRAAAEAVAQARGGMLRRVFRLLGLLYDTQTMEAVYLNWTEGDAQRQANAAEVLDQLLQGALRIELARIVAAPRTVQPYAGTPAAREARLALLRANGDDWLRRVLSLRGEADDGMREHMARIAMLQSVPMFEGIAARDLSPVALCLKPVELEAGGLVFAEGASGDSLYLVREGRAGVFRGDERIDTRGEGDSIGQTAILTSRSRTATVRAETRALLLRLDSADFYEVMFDRTDMALDMMKQLSRRLRAVLAQNAPAAAQPDAEPLPAVEPPNGTTVRPLAETGAGGRTADMDAALREAAAASESAARAVEAADPAAAGGSAKTAAVAAQAAASAPPSSGEAAQPPAASDGGQAAVIAAGGSPAILRRVLVLQKIELFAHLSTEDFVRLAQLVDELVFEPGEAICRADEYGDTMYGIIEGGVRVHRGADVYAELGEGQVFGEMAIIDSGPRSADCTALERTIVLQLSRDQVFSFCFQQIDVLKSMVQVMAARLRGML